MYIWMNSHNTINTWPVAAILVYTIDNAVLYAMIWRMKEETLPFHGVFHLSPGNLRCVPRPERSHLTPSGEVITIISVENCIRNCYNEQNCQHDMLCSIPPVFHLAVATYNARNVSAFVFHQKHAGWINPPACKITWTATEDIHATPEGAQRRKTIKQ